MSTAEAQEPYANVNNEEQEEEEEDPLKKEL